MKTRLMLLALTTFTVSTAAAEMYTWKDSKGTTFYTNSLHEIPARYVKRARVLDVATGKKGGPALEHPGTAPVAGGASPQQQTPPLVQSAVPQPQPAAPTASPLAAPVPAPATAGAAPAPGAPPSAVSAAPQQRSQVGRQRAPRRQRGSGEE